MLAAPMTDRDTTHGHDDLKVESCAHERPPRRVCDVCKTTRYAFTACSNQCLQAHQQAAHDPTLPADAATRVRLAQAERNRRSADVWDLYAPHRERVMALITAAPTGGTLCVLGAGRCNDIDLPRLAHSFRAIHLVDLDGEAMERVRDSQPADVRDMIVLHGGIDLSGLLTRLEEWGDAFPDDPTLHEAVFSAAHAVVDALRGPFDVTASTCVLSQLLLPFQNAWAASQETWAKMAAATTAVHVGILAHNTARGGAVSLVFDVLSSDNAPGLLALRDLPSEELQAAVDQGSRSGSMALETDPGEMLAQIGSSGVGAQQPAPRLTGPWLWDTSSALQLVYGLNFRRP
jgi:hypothetical protein